MVHYRDFNKDTNPIKTPNQAILTFNSIQTPNEAGLWLGIAVSLALVTCHARVNNVNSASRHTSCRACLALCHRCVREKKSQRSNKYTLFDKKVPTVKSV